MRKTIIVGDASDLTAIEAKKIHSDAVLLTKDNEFEILPNHQVCYTSLSDYAEPTRLLEVLCSTGLDVVFLPNANKYIVETYSQFKNGKEILNDLISDDQSCSIAYYGCSITYGEGVGINDRYVDIIYKHTGLSFINHSYPGNSINCLVDQLLLSNLQKTRLVIIGLPNENRFTLLKHGNHHPKWKKHCLPLTSNYTRNTFDQQLFFDSESELNRFITDHHHYYNSVLRLQEAINYCALAKVYLLVVNFIGSENLARQVQSMNCEFLDLNIKNHRIDVGSDGKHPGVLTHNMYASKIIEKIEQVFPELLKEKK